MRPANLRRIPAALLALAALATRPLLAQQSAVTSWVPQVAHPAYRGDGPRVGIDQAHQNFHTLDGNYRPFATLLRADGYRVEAATEPFTAASLRRFDVLVVANARGGSGADLGFVSAFTPEECDAVRAWVEGGGSLLLIADHAPFGGATEALAQRFGVEMGKGWVRDTSAGRAADNPTFLVFDTANGQLGDHPILRGRGPDERVRRVMTFTGQSLSVPAGATPLLRLSPTADERQPPSRDEAAAMDNRRQQLVDSVRAQLRARGRLDSTVVLTNALQGLAAVRWEPVGGRAQGLALSAGRGRVVVLGEAALFSAQQVTIPGRPTMLMGMNVPGSDDQQFGLNVLHWLSHLF